MLTNFILSTTYDTVTIIIILQITGYYSHFTDEEIPTEREIICPRTPSYPIVG